MCILCREFKTKYEVTAEAVLIKLATHHWQIRLCQCVGDGDVPNRASAVLILLLSID